MLEAVQSGRDEGVISTHSLAECYSALTTLPVDPRVQPVEARELIEGNIKARFERVNATEQGYADAIDCCVRQGLANGPVYDALLLACARVAGAERIYTFNLDDFRRLAPDLDGIIVAP